MISNNKIEKKDFSKRDMKKEKEKEKEREREGERERKKMNKSKKKERHRKIICRATDIEYSKLK